MGVVLPLNMNEEFVELHALGTSEGLIAHNFLKNLSLHENFTHYKIAIYSEFKRFPKEEKTKD